MTKSSNVNYSYLTLTLTHWHAPLKKTLCSISCHYSGCTVIG